MATGICPKCGSSCELIFRPYIKHGDKTVWPKKGKAFPIPICDCSGSKEK
jgi:hypothetical protein